MDRRDFIYTSAAGLGAVALTGATHAKAAEGNGKKYRVGLIGSGWYGKCDLYRLLQVTDCDVVSLCDVDKRMLEDAADRVVERQALYKREQKRPRLYGDYREMLKEKDLDIVIIGTPDHWHALPMIAAVEAGAHVYVQKPVSIDVTEGRAMLEAARRTGKVVQVGTQRRSTPHLEEARDLFIKTGRLGKIAHAEVCCYYHMRPSGNPPDIQSPEYLDWEMYTGPAPLRPYNSLVHPRQWRAFMEYGNGIVGDMCVHMLDTVRWMMDLGWPTKVSSAGGILVAKESKANISDTQSAIFDFNDLQVNWTHRTWGAPVDPKYPWSAIFYGDKGTLKVSVMSYDFIPQGNGTPVHKDVTYELEQYPEDATEKDIEKHVAPAIRAHMRNFLHCIEKGGRPVADIEQGYISTASCILANLSMALGRSLVFDPQTMQVVGDEEATKALTRAYRTPWEHPATKWLSPT